MPEREPRLDRLSDADDVAGLALGALAWLDRFAQEIAPRAPAGPEPAPVWIEAALGLLSLRRSLHRWIGEAGAQTPPPPAPARGAPEGLMR